MNVRKHVAEMSAVAARIRRAGAYSDVRDCDMGHLCDLVDRLQSEVDRHKHMALESSDHAGEDKPTELPHALRHQAE